MEVKLIHPSDPEKKVITATNEQQVAAYHNYGFIDEADLKADETAKADEANAKATLQSKLEATEKELAETQGALKATLAELKDAKKAKPNAAGHPAKETEGDK